MTIIHNYNKIPYPQQNRRHIIKQKLLSQQGNRCAICNKELSINEAVLDHDHSTGYIRGVLCNRCNLILGWIENDPDLLAKADEYIEGESAIGEYYEEE